MKLRKIWIKLLVVINCLIVTSVTNNSYLIDFILTIIFVINSLILLKWGVDNERI